jgi:hypothetical protein
VREQKARAEAEGRPYFRKGMLVRCKFRDNRGKRCTRRFKRQAWNHFYCKRCKPLRKLINRRNSAERNAAEITRKASERWEGYKNAAAELENATAEVERLRIEYEKAKTALEQMKPRPVSPGRPKLAPGKTRIFGIGQAVEQFIQPAKMALKIISGLPSDERGNLATLRAELLPLGFRKDEISLAQFARTAKQLARRVVAAREKIAETSVTRRHQEYLSELGRTG